MSRTRVELGRREDLGADCANCFGLCCVALAFARSVDFPVDKDAGEPCTNLDAHDGCRIHPHLRDRGYAGCTVFDCFGAGQKVSRSTFAGRSWRDDDATRTAMFAVFPVVRRLHELLWYLDEAIRLVGDSRDAAPWVEAFERVRTLSDAAHEDVLAVDVDAEYDAARPLLVEASAVARGGAGGNADGAGAGAGAGGVRSASPVGSARGGRSGRAQRGRSGRAQRGRSGRALRPGSDLAGADLHGADLRGVTLRGSLAIGADLRDARLDRCDLLGVDLRGADLSGADLRAAVFVTQPQVNSARGDARTRLPAGFERPSHWVD